MLLAEFDVPEPQGFGAIRSFLQPLFNISTCLQVTGRIGQTILLARVAQTQMLRLDLTRSIQEATILSNGEVLP